MDIRLLSPSTDNAAILLKLVEEFFYYEALEFDAVQTQASLDMITNDPAIGRVWLIEATKDKQTSIIGHVVASLGFSLEAGGRTATIDQLFILPDWRSCGVGTDIVPVIERNLAAINVVNLTMEVNIGNAGARRFYERMGFTPRRQHCLMSKAIGRKQTSPEVEAVT